MRMQLDDLKAVAKKHDEEFEIFSKVTKDPDLLVLKGHLLVERFLTSLIESCCWRPELIEDAKLSFFSKARLARCLVMNPMGDDSIWANVESLNRLRNELSHVWESNKQDKLMREFLSYRLTEHNEIDPQTIDLSTSERRAAEVSQSISWLLGQLSILDVVCKFIESRKTYG